MMQDSVAYSGQPQCTLLVIWHAAKEACRGALARPAPPTFTLHTRGFVFVNLSSPRSTKRVKKVWNLVNDWTVLSSKFDHIELLMEMMKIRKSPRICMIKMNVFFSIIYVFSILFCQRQSLPGDLIHYHTKYVNWLVAASHRTILPRLSDQELTDFACCAMKPV